MSDRGTQRTLRTAQDLLDAGLIEADGIEAAADVASRYAVAITPAMADLIDRADANDPIARQFVLDARELETRPEELADPIGDDAHSPVPGIVHRYPDRVLLKATHACPVYCRFCFRREMVGPGGEQALAGPKLAAALDYVRANPAIHEVIVTGGDPLVLAPRRLAEIARGLAAIPHVHVIRWHSRVPIVAPDRITPSLIDALRAPGKAVWIAIHTNHARELTEAARGALRQLSAAGFPLVSQTVLLKGVNDDPEILATLFRALIAIGVKPYYLHHADLAPGTSHFRTSIAEGQAIMRALRGRVSGLALPTYVLDVPGGFGKVPVGPDYVKEHGEVEDVSGTLHPYPVDKN
ncbi:MAG TPA: lysine-2,3-aminomutase-like protein [Hyphomicrobiaceae bacterium]|nr:lysine-2,3-aminomutase-like protein [Hyphomicrobiaceae bacterium]